MKMFVVAVMSLAFATSSLATAVRGTGLNEAFDAMGTPWLKLVAEFQGNTAEGVSSCTGFFISPRHLLTAAHCRQILRSLVGRIALGGDGNSYAERSLSVASVPLYDQARDIAVVEFDQPHPRLLNFDFSVIQFAGSYSQILSDNLGYQILSLVERPRSSFSTRMPRIEDCRGVQQIGGEYVAEMTECAAQFGQSGAVLVNDYRERLPSQNTVSRQHLIIHGVFRAMNIQQGRDESVFAPIFSVRQQLAAIPGLNITWTNQFYP